MSATKDIKKDPVIEMLKSELESDSKNELVKMLLYANPNGSGVQDGTQPVYQKLAERISAMNRSATGEFDYTDLELPTKSVSLPIRIRFAIEELVGALEMLNLARTRIHVETMNGGTWPASNVLVGSASIKVGLQFIKSMKAIVRDYLITQLPALIHDCYEAHYKNAGNFSYSLLETKLYVIKPEVMRAFINWVQNVILAPYVNVGPETPIFTTIINKAGLEVHNVPTRSLMLDEMWVDTTVVKTTGAYKYPPHYVKLCKVICARLGKLLRTPFSATEDWALEGPDSQAKYRAAEAFVSYCLEMQTMETGKLPSQAIMSAGSRKKDFQRAIYEMLLDRMNTAHTRAEANRIANGGTDVKAFIRHEVISLILDLKARSAGIGYQSSLVYLDSLMASIINIGTEQQPFLSFAQYFTKGEFINALGHFASGECNPRVMEAFYRFISTHSLSQRDSSRKKIPKTIEVEILKHVDLSRFADDRSDEPAICFSREALIETGMEKTPIGNLHDRKTGLDGLRQNGVMSLTAVLKDKAASAALVQTGKDALLAYANVVDEVADCYVMVYEAMFDARKAKKTKDAAAQRQLAKNTVRAGASPFAYVPSSPNVVQMPNYASPTYQGQVQGENLFAQAEPAVETQYAAPVQPVSQPKSGSSSPRRDSFSNQGSVPPFPLGNTQPGSSSPRRDSFSNQGSVSAFPLGNTPASPTLRGATSPLIGQSGGSFSNDLFA